MNVGHKITNRLEKKHFCKLMYNSNREDVAILVLGQLDMECSTKVTSFVIITIVLSPTLSMSCLKVHLMTDSELEDVHFTSDKAVVSAFCTSEHSDIAL